MREFTQVVTDYLNRVDAGEEVDVRQLIDDNSEHAERLSRFFSNLGVVCESAQTPVLEPPQYVYRVWDVPEITP